MKSAAKIIFRVKFDCESPPEFMCWETTVDPSTGGVEDNERVDEGMIGSFKLLRLLSWSNSAELQDVNVVTACKMN